MKVRDITDKIKGIVISKATEKEDFELPQDEENKIVEEIKMTEEKKAISDETESDDTFTEVISKDEPIKIRTIITTEEDFQKDTTDKLKNAVKVAAGIGVLAVGIAAIAFKSKRRR
jgi:hypothetical protein